MGNLKGMRNVLGATSQELQSKGFLYVGRAQFQGGWKLTASKWKNPFTVFKMPIEECIINYTKHLYQTGLINNLNELRGYKLMCWCDPNLCHAHVLRILTEHTVADEPLSECEALSLITSYVNEKR